MHSRILTNEEQQGKFAYLRLVSPIHSIILEGKNKRPDCSSAYFRSPQPCLLISEYMSLLSSSSTQLPSINRCTRTCDFKLKSSTVRFRRSGFFYFCLCATHTPTKGTYDLRLWETILSQWWRSRLSPM